VSFLGRVEGLRGDVKLAVKKYKIMCLSYDSNTYDQVCRKFIGQGTTVCVKSDCTKVHRGSKAELLPGVLLVVKTPGVVFFEPVTERHKLQDDLSDKWKDASSDLDDWVENFTLVETSSHPMGCSGYELAQMEAADTKAFKTISLCWTLKRRYNRG
jgi:hypothetical protein